MKSFARLLAFLSVVEVSTGFSASGQQRVFFSTPSKPIEKLVEDYMLLTIPGQAMHVEDSVDDTIAKLLRFTGTTGAPVVDDNQVLVGMVSALDILHKEAAGGSALLPIMMEDEDEQNDGTHFFSQIKAARKIIATQVGDLMTTEVITIEPQDTLRKAAGIMTEHQIHSLPVVDENGKLIGTLASSDVMRDVLRNVKALSAHIDEEVTELSP